MNARKLLNVLAFGLIVAGLILKTNEIQGKNILFMISAITMIISLGMFAIKDNRTAGLGNGLNFLLVGVIILLIIGTYMKNLHFEGHALFLVPGYALLLISIIALILQNETIKISKQFFISFALFFMFLMVMIPENPFFLNQFQSGHDAHEKCSKEEMSNKDCCKMEKHHEKECCSKK